MGSQAPSGPLKTSLKVELSYVLKMGCVCDPGGYGSAVVGITASNDGQRGPEPFASGAGDSTGVDMEVFTSVEEVGARVREQMDAQIATVMGEGGIAEYSESLAAFNAVYNEKVAATRKGREALQLREAPVSNAPALADRRFKAPTHRLRGREEGGGGGEERGRSGGPGAWGGRANKRAKLAECNAAYACSAIRGGQQVFLVKCSACPAARSACGGSAQGVWRGGAALRARASLGVANGEHSVRAATTTCKTNGVFAAGFECQGCKEMYGLLVGGRDAER